MLKQKTLLDTDFVQLCDEHGQPLYGDATISEVNQKGLWHLASTVLIWDKKRDLVLIQKRAPNIIYYPSHLEFSVAGSVKQGETSEQAALREVVEEVGIIAKPEQLTPLFISRYNHTSSRKRHSRVINHVFLLTLEETPDIHLLDHEVANAQFISWQSALRITTVHSYKSLGRLLPKYAFYRKLITIGKSRAHHSHLQHATVIRPV